MKKVAGLALALMVFSSAAQAECYCAEVPVEELAKSVRLAFSGTAYKGFVRGDGVDAMTFKTIYTYKGYPLVMPKVGLNRPGGDPDCALKAEIGKDYTILAYGSYEGGYYTDACAVFQMQDEKRWLKLQEYIAMNRVETMELEEQLRSEGPDLDVARELGLKYLKTGTPEQAVGQFELAAELSENEIEDLLNWGEALLLTPNSRAALSKFDDVLEKEPENVVAWHGRYRALAQLGRWEELPADKPALDLRELVLSYDEISPTLKTPNLGKAEWTDVVVKTALTEANLTAARLFRVRLENNNFSKSVFVRAKISGSSLVGGDFSGANFSLSRLEKVTLKGAKLVGANLRGAQWWDVDLSGADLTGANLDGIQFQKLVYDEATKWPKGYVPPKQ